MSYSALNKITRFWLDERSTINPKLYSVGVPITFLWQRRVSAAKRGKFESKTKKKMADSRFAVSGDDELQN